MEGNEQQLMYAIFDRYIYFFPLFLLWFAELRAGFVSTHAEFALASAKDSVIY